MEQLLDESKLPVTPDERRFEAGPLDATDIRDDGGGGLQGHRILLALEAVGAGIGVRDRRLRQRLRHLVDEDLTRSCGPLHP